MQPGLDPSAGFWTQVEAILVGHGLLGIVTAIVGWWAWTRDKLFIAEKDARIADAQRYTDLVQKQTAELRDEVHVLEVVSDQLRERAGGR